MFLKPFFVNIKKCEIITKQQASLQSFNRQDVHPPQTQRKFQAAEENPDETQLPQD